MAGGKETGRQKMIGMMYLVLTALLALNVSSTVIEKFIFLNDSLERANEEAEGRNKEILEAMRGSVEEKGNKPDDVKVIAAGDELRDKTAEVIEQLTEYKALFIEETGGYEEGFEGNVHHIKGKTNYDGVGHYMMPIEEGGQGHGKQMKAILTEYTEYVRGVLKEQEANEAVLGHFGNMTPDADEDPVYKEDPNQQGKKWSQLAFEYSPTHAGLATVSELQAEVLGFETKALDYLKTRTGMTEIVFDDIKPMVLPKSQYVISGSKYEAEMFIAASSSSADPSMRYNGQEIPVAAGMGKVEFTANLNGGKDIGNGIKEKTFTADITAATAAGDTTFSSTITYYVVKPAIVVTSNTAVALYANCANEVRVDVPGLTSNYNPTFSGPGAQFIKGGTAGEVNIVPSKSANKVVMSVSNGGIKIGDRTFKVNQVPEPNIVIKAGSTIVTPGKPLNPNTRELTISAIAKKEFKEGHEKDARYAILRATAVVGSSGKTIPVRNGKIVLAGSGIRRGDVLVIELQKVGRRNFQNKDEDVVVSQRYLPVRF